MADSNCGEVMVSKMRNSLIMRVIVFVSFVGFLIIVNEVTIIPSTSEESMPLSSTTTETTRTATSTSSSVGNNSGRHGSKPTAIPSVAKSYMASERRVPNGPDPIHNRRARKSKEPPGRA